MGKISVLDLDELIILYCYKNLSDSQIAALKGCSISTVIRTRQRHNIKKLFRNKEWLYQKYIIEDMTFKQIAKIINCNEDTVSINYRKLGLEVDKTKTYRKNRKYYFDENIFEEIDTPEKAYWLGFITADGCIETTKNEQRTYYRLKILLSKKDDSHLTKFAKFIGNEKLNHIYSTIYLNATQKEYEQATIQINSKKIINDLISLGIEPKKSTKERPPLFLKKEFIRDFIRGEFDGDGSIAMTKSNITIVGSFELMNWIKKKVDEHFNRSIGYVYKDCKSQNLFSYQIHAKKDVFLFLEWIYKDSSIYLERKYNDYKTNKNNNFYIDKRYSPNIQGKPEEIGRNDLSPDDNQE